MEPASPPNPQLREMAEQPEQSPSLVSPDTEATAASQGQPNAEDYVSNPFQVYIDSLKKLFSVNFLTLLGIAGSFVLTGIAVALFSTVLVPDQAVGAGASSSGSGATIAVIGVGILIVVLWAVILEAAWTKYAIETARDNKLSFGQAMRSGLKKGPGLLVVKIITGLAVMVGFILFIVPGLMVMYWLFFATSVYVDKDVGILVSLRESKRLVREKLVELFGLLGASFVFVLPTMVPLVGFLYQIVLAPVSQIAWQYRYTSADMLDVAGLPKPPTHVANKVAAVGVAVLVILLLVGMATIIATIYSG